MRRRLWYLITSLSVGGTERTLISLANRLDTSRYEVTVWTIFDQNPLAGELAEHVHHRTLGAEGVVPDGEARVAEPDSPSTYVTAPLRFLRAVSRERPDLLHSFLFYGNVFTRFAGVVAPDTSVITGVRSVPDERPVVKELADRTTARLSDAVVSNSEAGAGFARERGVPPERVTVIPNGRELRTYRDAPESGVREALGLPSGASVVGTVGRLIERKGHEELLEAWPIVREHHPRTHLLVVGDGPERSSLEEQAATLNQRQHIHFLGMRDDVPRLLQTFDVFAFPSHFEGLPGALIEAMAAGLPIVTTPVDGNSELVSGYRTGLHVESKNSGQLAWAVVRLLKNPSLAADLGKKAQRAAFERYSIEQMVESFDELYQDV